MSKELPKAYNPKNVEEKIYKFWEKSGLFNPDRLPVSKNKKAKKFVAAMAPLNITGEAHMGHALENTLLDILIRKERMQNKKVLWIPGTDHAGIATQNVVEKELKKEGKTRFDLGREKFIERVWQWREKYGNIILGQLKKLGLSCDWSRTRFTMDRNYTMAVLEAFSHYYKKGWIYRGRRVINWCPRCQTSLSDLELENREERGKLYYIRYPLKLKTKSEKRKTSPSQIFSKNLGGQATKNLKLNNQYIVVATTRPETMLGDTAVAVNPKDRRYKDLIGQKAILPLQNREIPIIADKVIDMDFGTGVLKVTPAHDATDWEIGLSHRLAALQVIGEKGKMTKESGICEGLRPDECRRKVLDLLEKEGFLEKTEDYKYVRPYCYRCHNLIEPLVSKQWFLRMEELAKKAIEAVKTGKVKFVPKNFEKIYFNWLTNIQDWCISRQIWWGHQLPVWFCQTGSKLKVKSEKLKVNEPYFVSLGKPTKCQICHKCQPKQVEDVLDTWFSSALWPFAILGWPKITRDLRQFYPTHLISSDRGIINLWQARMIFSGLEFTKTLPFSKIYIHATVLTKEGKRMSKSLGTGIDPSELIEKYGADATRFGLAWQTTGVQDIRFDEGAMLTGKKFCNKVWNAARFVLNQTSNEKFKVKNEKLQFKIKNLTQADKKILHSLERVIKSTNRELDNFRFGQAAQSLYHFFWHEFCDKYIELSKSKIQKEPVKTVGWWEGRSPKSKTEKENTLQILLYVFLTSLKLLHPFIPFITEEIYQQLPLEKKKKSLMVEEWPQI